MDPYPLEEEVSQSDMTALESEKLRVEIRELRFRLKHGRSLAEAERKRGGRNTLIAWLGIVTAVVTAVAGGSGIYTQVQSYRRQHEVQVTDQLIKLVEKLDSAKDFERESSALLLSAYETDALPVLLWNLERAKDPAVTVQALHLLVSNRNVGDAVVFDAILKAADQTFKREIARSTWSVAGARAVRNLTMALGTLRGSHSKQALALLEQWERILGDSRLAIPEVRRNGLREEIAAAKGRIGV